MGAATWHRLTDVDLEAKTGTCSICGPTRVRIRKTRAHECYAKRQADLSSDRRRSPAARRRRMLRTVYGISVEEYDDLRSAQDYRCAICRRHEDDLPAAGKGRPRRDGTPAAPSPKLVIDHCHREGHVRALLCSPCNTGLGNFGDDAHRLRAAADWLDQEHRLASPRPAAM